jgi:hypothetical protein
MTPLPFQFGTQNDLNVGDGSSTAVCEEPKINTLDDLLCALAIAPPPSFPMLRTTCALLGNYLNRPMEQISIDHVSENREGFRAFLRSSKYKEGSIRSYVNFAVFFWIMQNV